MPLLVESLKASNGQFEDLEPHMERMSRSTRDLFGVDAPDLSVALKSIKSKPGSGIWKVRVLYDTDIREVQAAIYQPRKYSRIVLVDGKSVDYRYKTAERPILDELSRKAVEAGGDTALIDKDGLITDFSYANAAFFDGSIWWTPAQPLLEGTRRARLLKAGLLRTANIRYEDILSMERVSPINAMMDLDEVSIPISYIYREPDREVI